MSLYWDIVAGVETVVGALSAITSNSVMVKVQKRPFFSPDHGHTLPFLSLVMTKERKAALQMEGAAWWDHPIHCVLIQTQSATVEDRTAMQLQATLRQALRDALYQTTLSGVATVYDTDYEPDAVLDLGGLDQLFDTSIQLFTFRAATTRAS